MTYPGVHICAVVNSEDEQTRLAKRFVASGLGRKEKVIYIAAKPGPHFLTPFLHGMGYQASPREGFVLLCPAQAYLQGGFFDGAAMTRLMEKTIGEAFAQGYRGVRLAGEMNWAVAAGVCAKDLLAYETAVDRILQHPGVITICQYQRAHADMLTPKALSACHNHIGAGDDLVEWL